MIRSGARLRLVATGLLLGAVLALAPAAWGAGPSAAIDVDLRTDAGTRVAGLFGSVGANGRGFATIVPLSGAGGVDMVRGETARVLRRGDGSLLVLGGLGTRLDLRLADGRAVGGEGRLALAARAARTIGVTARGVSSAQPFRPRAGQVMIVIGRPDGRIRAALERRYRLVRYRASVYSRDALLGAPDRLDRVAGVVVGDDVPLARLRRIDILRGLYNAGRWVAVDGNPTAFDRHMYVVAHAHFGPGGVMVRQPLPRLGASRDAFLQVREPRVAHVRTGVARARVFRLTPTQLRQANAIAARALDASIRRGETYAAGAKARQGSGPSTPATVTTSASGLAVFTIPVDQTIVTALSVPSIFNVTMAAGNCAGNSQYNPNNLPCPPSVITQMVEVAYNPIYTVSLAVSPDGEQTQVVSETNAASVTAAGSVDGVPTLAVGSYDPSTNVVTPQSFPGTFDIWEYNLFYVRYLQTPNGQALLQNSALTLASAYHSVVMQCSGCVGTQGGTVGVSANVADSQPVQTVTQVGQSTSAGSDWETSVSKTSGWEIDGNVGFFGSDPTAGVSGGYNDSTTSESSSGGSLETSTSFSLSNWTTNPFQGTGPGETGQATYGSFSSTVPSVPVAASSVQYPTQIDAAAGGYIPVGSQYGGPGPAPACTYESSYWNCIRQSSAPGLGSSMNVADFQQGSVSAFSVETQANQLAVGSITPYVVDSFYLVDQVSIPAGAGNPNLPGFTQPGAQQFTELQILDQSFVSAATPLGAEVGANPQASAQATQYGSGIAQGLTTYYNGQGQVISGQDQGVYTTIGLDLCAPPVLTVELWNDGCDTQPGLTGSQNPPATLQGAGPAVSSPDQSVSNGQAFAELGATLSCAPGTWSGSPTYTYQWQVWAPESVWVPVKGATGTTFKPKAAGYYLCTVTAKNAAGSVQASSLSVQMISAG